MKRRHGINTSHTKHLSQSQESQTQQQLQQQQQQQQQSEQPQTIQSEASEGPLSTPHTESSMVQVRDHCFLQYYSVCRMASHVHKMNFFSFHQFYRYFISKIKIGYSVYSFVNIIFFSAYRSYKLSHMDQQLNQLLYKLFQLRFRISNLMFLPLFRIQYSEKKMQHTLIQYQQLYKIFYPLICHIIFIISLMWITENDLIKNN